MLFADNVDQFNGGIVGTLIGVITIGGGWLATAYARVVKDRKDAREEDNRRVMEREKFRAETEAAARREWRELSESQRREINELRERITRAEMESRECEKRFKELKEEFEELKAAQA